MKLLFMIGNSAAGKMTVGQELTKITPFRLFHNHMMIEPVLEVFGSFRGDVIQKLRGVIFEEFAKSDQYGLIFTFMWAFDMPSDWAYLESVKAISAGGGYVLCGADCAPVGASAAQRLRKPSEAQGFQAGY